jgi:hypothetical protein
VNLSEIRNMVGSIVDYDPNVQTYIDEVNRVVNEIYLDFFTDRPWKFAQETEEIQVYQDVITTNATIGIGSSSVVDISAPFLPWMEGAIVELVGNITTADNGEYIIAKSTAGGITLEGFIASANDGVTATVKQRFVDMPADCSEVMSIGIRSPTSGTQAHFDYLSRNRDEELSLLLSSTGLPTDWLIHDDITMTQPVLASALAINAAGTLGAGLHYVKYTFIHKNKESAPSPASTVTLGAADSIDISGLQDTGANSGILKKAYIRTPDSKAYYDSSAATAAETVPTIGAATLATSYLVAAKRLPENDGHYKRVRLYPRQDTDYLVEVRFVFRPDRLIEETDVPEFPPDHHRYLVYRACQELFVKHDNITHSEVYRRKADVELLRMENTYLSEGAGYWIKQGYRESQISYRTATSLTTSG